MDFVSLYINKVGSSILIPKSLLLWLIVHCLSSWKWEKVIGAIL